MSRQAVWESVQLTVEAVLKTLPKANSLRDYTRADLERTARGFQRRSKLKGVIGALDATNIHTNRLFKGFEGRSYFNKHKKSYTVKLQAVADSDGVFIDYMVGAPGAMHDSAVLRASRLLLHLERMQTCVTGQHYLVADAGYPQLPCVMRPFDYQTSTPKEKAFNKELSGMAQHCR